MGFCFASLWQVIFAIKLKVTRNSSLGILVAGILDLGVLFGNSRIPYYVIPQLDWGISIWNSSLRNSRFRNSL